MNKQSEILFQEVGEEANAEVEQQSRSSCLRDASFQIHQHETNPESEKILFENYERFSNNCKVLFRALMAGAKLNSVNVAQQFRIIDWRRRRKDIEENGVRMHSEPSPLGKGLKDWFFTDEDKLYNQKFTEVKH